MNTALYTADDAGGSVGRGLAIPGNDVQFVLNNLREHGRVRFGFIARPRRNCRRRWRCRRAFPAHGRDRFPR
jgi:S1-C subfamily serine protease